MAYPVIPTPDDLAFFERSKITDSKLMKRITMERMVIRKLARDLIAAGFWLRLYDGEAWAHKSHQDVSLLMADLMATDEEALSVRIQNPHAEGKFIPVGNVSFVYGNEGHEVIADNSVCLEKYMDGVNALIAKLEEA